jgi:hypothetical protein
MPLSLVRPSLVALVTLAFMRCVSAGNSADIARDWGLLGTWAIDCAKPTKGKGNVISYEINSAGKLIYRRDHDAADTNAIVDARIASDHTLILSIEMPQYGQTRENGVSKEADGSIHTLYNRGEDGIYSVRDSRFVANGVLTPRLHKCEQTRNTQP